MTTASSCDCPEAAAGNSFLPPPLGAGDLDLVRGLRGPLPLPPPPLHPRRPGRSNEQHGPATYNFHKHHRSGLVRTGSGGRGGAQPRRRSGSRWWDCLDLEIGLVRR